MVFWKCKRSVLEVMVNVSIVLPSDTVTVPWCHHGTFSKTITKKLWYYIDAYKNHGITVVPWYQKHGIFPYKSGIVMVRGGNTMNVPQISQ